MSARVFASHVEGDDSAVGPGSTRLAPLILRNARLAWHVRRAGEHLRSPFFDASGTPVREPQLVSAES